MKERVLTCIVCPRGCSLTATVDDAGRVSVTGGACPRGAAYAEQECTCPERTVTTTVRTEGGRLVACKTARAVPKERVMDVMAEINRTVVRSGASVGEVLIRDVAGTGVAVVATAPDRD